MNPLQSSDQPSAWAMTHTVLNRQRRPMTQLAVLGYFLPLVANEVILGRASGNAVEKLREAAEAMAASPHYLPLLEATSSFLGPYLLLGLTTTVLVISSYLGVVSLTAAFLKGNGRPDVATAWKGGFRCTLPKGLLLLLFLLLVGSGEQAFFGPLRLLTLLTSMAAVLMVVEGKGLFGSLRSALGLRYVNTARGSGWRVLFSLVGLSFLLFAGESLLALLSEFLIRTDLWLSLGSGPWEAEVPFLPGTGVWWLARLFVIAGYSAVLLLVPVYTVCLYLCYARDDAMFRAVA